MTCQQRYGDVKAAAVQDLGEHVHLIRRAGKAMHEQHAARLAGGGGQPQLGRARFVHGGGGGARGGWGSGLVRVSHPYCLAHSGDMGGGAENTVGSDRRCGVQ